VNFANISRTSGELCSGRGQTLVLRRVSNEQPDIPVVKETWRRPASSNGNCGSWKRPTALCRRKGKGGRRSGPQSTILLADRLRTNRAKVRDKYHGQTIGFRFSGRPLVLDPLLRVASETTPRCNAFFCTRGRDFRLQFKLHLLRGYYRNSA
jgi:hypothetical protein